MNRGCVGAQTLLTELSVFTVCFVSQFRVCPYFMHLFRLHAELKEICWRAAERSHWNDYSLYWNAESSYLLSIMLLCDLNVSSHFSICWCKLSYTFTFRFQYWICFILISHQDWRHKIKPFSWLSHDSSASWWLPKHKLTFFFLNKDFLLMHGQNIHVCITVRHEAFIIALWVTDTFLYLCYQQPSP